MPCRRGELCPEYKLQFFSARQRGCLCERSNPGYPADPPGGTFCSGKRVEILSVVVIGHIDLVLLIAGVFNT